MDYITQLYHNKTIQLQEQIKLLEAKLLKINEGIVLNTGKDLITNTGQEFKKEFVDPTVKWAGRGKDLVTSPIETTGAAVTKVADAAKTATTTTKNAVVGTAKTAAKVVTNPSVGVPEALLKAKDVAKGVVRLAGPASVGYWASEATDKPTEMALDAFGVEDPLYRESTKMATGFGAFSGAAVATSSLLGGAAPGAALAAGGAAVLPGVVAGAAILPVAYGAYKAGGAIDDATGLTDKIAKTYAGQEAKGKPVDKYPTVAELQAQTQAERAASPIQISRDKAKEIRDEDTRRGMGQYTDPNNSRTVTPPKPKAVERP